MNVPLTDIKVLDLSRIYAAPVGTMILADLGADVIRVESPKGTDSMRKWPPHVGGESTYYFTANRNKRSVTLDLKHEEGKALFLQLAKKADVVVENFKTGTLERLGLGYAALAEANPSIILCSVTGYGQTGPYREEPGFDPVIQAIGGLMDITGERDGEPMRVGVPVVDMLSSLYVAIGILAAIRQREQTGEGQHIDISLLDVQMSSLANIASVYLIANQVTTRIGNQHNNVAPYQVFGCSDRPLMIAVGNDAHFSKLCDLVQRPEWKTDDRYRTNEARVANRTSLTEELQSIFSHKSAEEWFQLLSGHGIPSGPVNNVEQAFNHPQVQAREMVQKIHHPTLGEIKLVRNPILFSKTPITTHKHPPLLGEHTDSFFQEELGLRLEEIDRLRTEGII